MGLHENMLTQCADRFKHAASTANSTGKWIYQHSLAGHYFHE